MISLEVSKTYEVVTEESARRGETSDNGYCFSPMLLHLRDALNEVEKLGSFEMTDHGNCIDLYGIDEEINYRTGEHTTYHLRVKSTPRIMKRFIKLIRK